MTALQKSLIELQLRLSVVCGRQLTHEQLAEIAGTTTRSLGEWMRGTTSPKAITSLLNLLSRLDRHEDVMAVLSTWKQGQSVSNNRKNQRSRETRQ